MSGLNLSKKRNPTFKNNRKVSRRNQINYWRKHWRAGILRFVERALVSSNVSESLAGNSIQILHLPEISEQIEAVDLISQGEVLAPIRARIVVGPLVELAGVRQPIYRLVINNAKISMLDGSVWLKNGFVLDAILPAWQKIIYAGGISDSLFNSKKSHVYFQGDWVFLAKSDYFYHQLIEDLPILLTALNDNPKTKILVSSEAQKTIIKLISLLPNEVHITSNIMVEIERLHAVTAGRVFSRREGQILKNFAAEHVLTNPKNGNPKKLFISRGKLDRGDLELERILFDQLETLGFSKIDPEQIDIIEQIELFTEADVIVGFHGGALSNMVWMKPNSRIVEIFNHEYRTYDFMRMAHELGHQYRALDFSSNNQEDLLYGEMLARELREPLE